MGHWGCENRQCSEKRESSLPLSPGLRVAKISAHWWFSLSGHSFSVSFIDSFSGS